MKSSPENTDEADAARRPPVRERRYGVAIVSSTASDPRAIVRYVGDRRGRNRMSAMMGLEAMGEAAAVRRTPALAALRLLCEPLGTKASE